MFRAAIRKELDKIIPPEALFSVERSENFEHGDYSSNVALLLAKKERKNPKEVAEEIKNKIGRSANWRVEIAGPGFLNFWISHSALTAGLQGILKNKKSVFKSDNDKLRIDLEFVSANPTGPLTMANGRGGFYGDALANILKAVGHKVTREYFVNDAGNQIKLLGESILAAEGNPPVGGEPKEEYYKGAYIKKLKGKSAEAAVKILLGEIKKSLKKAGVKFNVWFSEASMRKKGELKKTLELLNKKKILKEGEGALWLGDAVVVKSNQEYTYFLADLAYHYDKFIKRKFDLAVNIWGADHHGYVSRMQKGIEALGVNPARLKIIIMQLVRLVKQGKEIKMSKRAGEFITLDDLLKEVGADAARWFFLERSPDTHMDFDLDLAKERSKKNPVYYVQYAHARASSILRKAQQTKKVNLNLLTQPEELNLIKKILRLPEVIEDIAEDYQVHRLPRYAYELAQTFTNFYEKHQVIDLKNPELTQARLALVYASRSTFQAALSLMGIAAPKKM